jgi:hypothetical protein
MDAENLQARYLDLINRPDVSEEEVHQFLVRYPAFLPLWFPYENTVFSKLPLGNQHVVDFAFARENTPGVTWHLVEIEKPQSRLFTKSGNPSAALSHGLRQILDWKTWFLENRDYVRRYFPYREQVDAIGLCEPELLLVIGRRAEVADGDRKLMQRLSNGVDIMTFDRLAEHIFSPPCDRRYPIRSCRFVGGVVQKVSIEAEMTMSVHWSVKDEGT